MGRLPVPADLLFAFYDPLHDLLVPFQVFWRTRHIVAGAIIFPRVRLLGTPLGEQASFPTSQKRRERSKIFLSLLLPKHGKKQSFLGPAWP